jgi:NitT/TauT family transport system ATP-binding protein
VKHEPASCHAARLQPLLEVCDVTLQYRTSDHVVTATSQVSFQIYPADRFIVLGPSGCGKSTLLKAIAGFIAPAHGSIRLKGKPVTRPGPDRMMVFQEFDQLLPWKTVRQNVVFPLRCNGVPADEANARAADMIEKVSLTKFGDVYPHMLSGGMKQRVAIARAMCMRPDMLLMDEPYAALDALTRRKMQQELLDLWDDIRFTVVFVTHSIEEAVLVGSRILVLSSHPGQVKAELNVHHVDVNHHGSAEFQSLCGRIHAILFDDGPPAR